ncbi:HlyC/CorC family transporter [uncultured Pseudoteredinibacter sp.]|uniref:HlyC/CorC family transporter n=1 Tax=uncultured Pseudoteredinibacter sp. TaxID=1641701 RepID=UPI002603C88B|nr:HlyC/CorC family transporter [uncultured Pseudoteredinibacter sp.]
MNEIPISLLFAALAVLVLLSAFFSSSETGMMAINRYRLRHLANKGNSSAKRVSKLLQRPDRLIGVILIGNNLVNNAAAAIATVIATTLYGQAGIIWSTVLLTLVVLIFSEVTPKTIAALHPEKIAFPASWVLRPLLILLIPAVWLVNGISNRLARLFGVNPLSDNANELLRPEELRTAVDEAGDLIPDQHQGMLLNILDLEKATVEDIMVPRNEVVGLDIEEDVPTLMEQIRSSAYTRLPVYEGDINNIIGVMHLRNAAKFIYGGDETITHEAIKRFAREPYFVPESTPLHVQLLNFQKEKRRIAIAVDEYGDVQGIVTLEDLLEEIVGDFTTNLAEEEQQEISALENDWYAIEGSTSIRDINKQLGWDLPVDGPKTLNGLILEHIESIPAGHMGFSLGKFQLETTRISNNMIEVAKVRRR